MKNEDTEMIIENLKKALHDKGITVYELSECTGIKYELLRRSLNGTRNLKVDELAMILRESGICFEDIN